MGEIISVQSIRPKSTLGVGLALLVVPVEPPTERLRGFPDRCHIRLEITTNTVYVWDEVGLTDCGKGYHFAGPYVRGVLTDIPYFDAVYRALADHYVANRGGPLGAFVEPALRAMSAALAVRDGSSVYFAAAGGLVKIGWSRNVAGRIASLQTGSPAPIQLLATEPGGRARERELHEQFATARTSGEWFEFTPELATYIQTVRR